MDVVNEVDVLLSNAVLEPEGWFDYYEDVAIRKVTAFNDDDWLAIKNLWPVKDDAWQMKFAGLLGGVNYELAIPILEEMVIKGSTGVVSEALNSLNNMDGDDYFFIPKKEMGEQLQHLYKTEQHTIKKQTIASLLSRIK